MPLPTFDHLFRLADARPDPAAVAVAGGADETVLRALRRATDRRWIRPILVGEKAETRRLADELAIALDGFTLIDAEDAAAVAVGEIHAGRASLLMKGRIATPLLMKAVLDPERGLRGGRSICQVVLMEIPRDGRRFLLADTGIMIKPGLPKKVDILGSVVEVAHGLGVAVPLVALMAASETVSVAMPETAHAAELQRRNEAGEFPGCVVQGPLSFDLAYAADAGEKKRIGGPVVGAADAMVFPDLASANLTVKAIMYTADCRFGGILKGTTHPVVFMSRADSVDTRTNSLALALGLLQ